MNPFTILANRYVQIAIAVAVGIAALWGYGTYQHHLGYTLAQSERHTADLEAFKSEVLQLNGLSVKIEQQIVALRSEQPKIIERYTRVVEKNPLPAGCVIDAERLRTINEAIKAAASGKFSHTVPDD